jgi:hypothetical protein
VSVRIAGAGAGGARTEAGGGAPQRSQLFNNRGRITDERDYVELGADYLDQLDSQRVTRYLVKRLERLGYEVTLTPEKAAA